MGQIPRYMADGDVLIMWEGATLAAALARVAADGGVLGGHHLNAHGRSVYLVGAPDWCAGPAVVVEQTDGTWQYRAIL